MRQKCFNSIHFYIFCVFIFLEFASFPLVCSFFICIRNDKNNFFTTPKDLLDAFKDILENRINPRLLDLFHNKPATKLEIVEVSNFVENNMGR